MIWALTIVVIVNVVYFSGYKSEGEWYSEVTRFVDQLGTASYYVVESKWAKEKLGKEILESAPATPVDLKEVVAEIAALLRNDGGEGLYANATAVVTSEYAEQVRQQFVEEARKNATREFLHTLDSSYAFLENVRKEYLQDHVKEVDSVRGNFLRGVLDEVVFSNAPRLLKLTRRQKGTAIGGNMFREVGRPTYSREFLTHRRVLLSQEQVEELQRTHDGVVQKLMELLPLHLVYRGSGIVISANSVHLIGAMMLVVHLRQLRSELPIEVVLDSRNDYNVHACEEFLPRYNASCVVTEDVLGAETYSMLGDGGFLRKSVALLVSSFDQVIALDADNLPTRGVDFLLTSSPFLRTRFILWPDAWHKGTSPLYYDIARFRVGEIVRRHGWPNDGAFADYISHDQDKETMFHDRAGLPSGISVESGQLVVSKRHHLRSLLLAVYYNANSDFYYPLLYQGVFGSGDRETFVPALHVMNEPYYLVDVPLSMVGVQRSRVNNPQERYLDELTLVQYDPVDSDNFAFVWSQWLRGRGLDSRLYAFQDNSYSQGLLSEFWRENPNLQPPRPLFLHVHDPKLNPVYNEVSPKDSYDYRSRYIRLVGEFDQVIGSQDWELRLHSIFRWLVCDAFADSAYYSAFDLLRKDLCKKILDYVDVLRKDTNDPNAYSDAF